MLRFSPSPTKDLDVQNLRVAIFNYIISKQLNEDLIVRIEDIDKEKNIEGKDKEILEILNLFSIEYKNGIHQSESLKYHQKLAMQLMSQKNAFACFCGEAKLKELEQAAKKDGKTFNYDGFCQTLSDETVLNTNAPFTVRIKKPQDNIKFNDLLKGYLEFTPLDIDSFIILNHDKTPTYDYACAIDDMLMNISTVIRDEKYTSNTPKQIYIRNLFGYDNEIKYLHLPTLNDTTSIKSLIDKGFLPSAIANYIVLISTKTPCEIFTLEDAINWFKIEDIKLDNIKFDIEKLKLINKKHLESIDEMRLSKILGFADADIGKLGKLFLDEVNTINEIKERIELVFSPKIPLKGYEEEFEKIKSCLQEAPYMDSFEKLEKYIKEKTGLAEKDFSKPLQYLFTKKETGPSIYDIYPLIKNYLGEIIK